MQPYQETYIGNCRTIWELTASRSVSPEQFDRGFDRAMEDLRRARELAEENTRLLQAELLPLLDDLHLQGDEVLAGLEEFADALTRGPKTTDVALACQIHEALLTCARRRGRREAVIRELYKLGMAWFPMYNVLSGMEIDGERIWTVTHRMRYCFVEASSYLKYFDEFGEETQGYILRSLANIYLGKYQDWREKLNVVRDTMRVFHDEHYRQAAPGLPWDRYLQALHRQMAGVVPYGLPEGSLSADEVADVMESAHLVFEKKFEDVRHGGENVEAHDLLPYYGVEFCCGLLTREQLMKALEDLLDRGDPTRYDNSSTYTILSLTAYYVHYLETMPELIEPRRGYIDQLYDKMLGYVRAMPAEVVNDQVRLYVRQVVATFMELEGGLTYKELLLALMARFTPELYAHGVVVSRIAREICQAILDGDPAYFDEVPEAAAAPSPEARRAAVLGLAEDAGMLHDMGKMSFTSLYGHQGRQMLHSEEEILQCHSLAGWAALKKRPSTAACADAALGHHRWYDGSDGYPEEYRRMDSPYRALVDVLCLADYLDREGDADDGAGLSPASFEEELEQILRMEGRQFSPLVTSWLRDPALRERLRPICGGGYREGYRQCLRLTAEGAG